VRKIGLTQKTALQLHSCPFPNNQKQLLEKINSLAFPKLLTL